MLLVRCTRHLFFVKLLCILFLVATKTSENDLIKECPTEIQDGIVWPKTMENECTSSEPMCLDTNREIIKRCCLENQIWEVSPACESYQDDTRNPCPDSSIRKSNICLFVLNSTFPPKCPYAENLDFQEYIDYVDDDLFPIWLPVEKEDSIYGEGLYYWKEKSENYMSVFNSSFIYDQNSTNKSCLLYYPDFSVQTARCDEIHTAICAYDSITNRNKTFCSQVFGSSCKQSSYSPNSTCFCSIHRNEEILYKIELLIPYQNLLFQNLDETCYIGLQKTYNGYIWVNSNTSIDYTYWSRDASFGKNYLYGVISADGWLLTSEDQENNCTLIEKMLPEAEDEIILAYNETSSEFTVTIRKSSLWKHKKGSDDPLIICFTDTSIQHVIKKLNIKRTDDNRVVSFTFPALEDGPGNYWCNGFLYPTLEVKRSEIYFIRPSYEEFVAPISHLFSDKTNPFSEEYLQYTQELMEKELERNLPDTPLYPRIFGISNINLNTNTAVLNYHFTTNVYVSVYSTHMSLLSLQLDNFSLSSVYTFSSCIGGRTTNSDGSQITWTTTEYGNTLYKPNEGWCIDQDGFVVTRTCKGNFIEGASWSDISGQNCSLDWYDVSPTLILEQIINAEHPNMYLPLVVLQAQRIYEMQSNDVDLVAVYLNILVQQNNDINITQLSQLVDAVMKIPQSVLKASQESYKSTDKILNNFLEILRKTNFIGTVTQDYLSITSFSIDTFYSDTIIWRKVNDTYIVDFFNSTDSNIKDEEAFESGIILNPEIMKDISNISNNNSRIIIIAYFKPTLFNEYFVRDYKSIIYSTLFLNMNISSKNNLDLNLSVVIYNNNFSSNTFSCSYWNDGFWIHKTTSHSDSKILCSFENTINVGLVSTTNITALLEELQKDISCYDSISKTLMYLKKYLSLFQPIDVSIVNLILDKCKDEDLFHIHMNIVNQLLDLPVNIIQTARTEFNANILQTFEQILIGYNREFPLTEFKNFMVAIQDIDQKNLTGLYISCNKNKCSVKMMHNYSYIPEESEIYLVFDEHLLDQFISNKIPRIIITLFANDAFFLTKSEYGEKSFSIIIGVTIPGFDMELEGNISVTYKLHSEVVDKTCEYWDNYEQKWVVSSPGISMNNQSYICTFSKTSYYVLAFNALNVTNLLETLLNSKENNLDILEGIENITSKHLAKLEAIDISLIAIYFQTIQNEDELGYDEIDISIQIINNIMHAARYIIQQAESEFYASSKILMFLKKQMTKIETSQTFCSTRIIVTVSYNTNVSGIEIYDNKNFCNYELIEKNHDYGINTTGIVFTGDYMEQISNSDQKIIIIAFYNNVFFYDGVVNNLEENIMTIGVLVPDNTVNKFNEEISVFYSNITNDLNTITCVSWGLYDPKNIADGFWELQRKLSDDYSCNYFKEGWYTLWTQDQQINVTLMLEDIKDGSVERKLDQLEAVTSFYDSFSSHDVFLMLNILYRCTDLTTDSGTLSVLGRIIINFSKIPKDVKKNSQKQYKTNAIMLNFISKLATLIDTNINYNIKNYFQISVCNLTESSSIIIMDENIDCYSLEENNYNYSLRLDYYPYILVNPEVLTVTIFKNNELFQNDENYDTSDIIHLSLKSYYNQLSTFTVEFNQVQIQKIDYSCACGSGYGTSSDHNWMYFKTIRNDFLTICEVPNLVTCSYVSLVNLSVTDILSDIYYRSGTSNKLLLLVNVLTYYQDQLQLSHIEKVYDILNICEIGDDKDLQNLAAIVDVIMDLDRNILASARDNFTEELHNCIEKLIKQFKGETRILQYTNFAVLIGSDITGILFEESNSSMYSIKRVLTDEFDTLYTSDITLIISSFMVDELDTEYTKVYLTVYFNDALFIGRLNMAFKKYGIIIGLEFVDQTIGDYMKIYFDNYQNNTNVCAYWNHQIIDTNIQTWYWDTVNQSLCENRKGIKYFAVLENYNVTGKLEDIFQSNSSTEDQLQEVIDIVSENSGDLKPIDIHLIANILGKMLLSTNITKEHIELTSCIISYLFTVNKQILAEAQAIYSATDSILFTVDEVLRRCEDVFVEPIIYNNFTIIKAEFKTSNVTGVILDECANTTCKISFLMNQTQMSVISTESMEISIIFSDKLMQQIVSNGNPVKLILTVHFHNNFFTSVSNKDIQTSKILGIILDGLEDPVLQGPILITYKANHLINDNGSCSFWNYQVQTYNGYWQHDSTPTNFGNKYLTCEYHHLTHFVLLLAGSSGAVDYMNNSHILDILTNINSILSLLGLFGILLTAVLFDRWRNNTGNQILINFTVAVSIKNVMLYISEGVYSENNSSMGCTITGGILHYSILSEFCWMLIIAILQFKRFVEVLGGPLKYVLLKACICGWVFPSLPVFLIIIIDVNNYNASKVGLCYPSGFGLYLGVWLPLLVIISINSIIFVFILYNVFHKKTEYREQVNHEIIFQWRLAILLFSMLGLTWVFGFLALLSSVTIFAVIFCFLATLQGFIMFLFFIVFNKNTRYMYIQGFSWWMYSKGYKDRLH